jgi:hypothetical protein
MGKRLESDVMGFFKVYYSELRRLVLESDAAELADWVKGERVTDVYACVDGVIVVQVYPDRIPSDASLKVDEDGNLFRFNAAQESLVKELFPSAIPPRPGGGGWPQLRYPDYETGRPFGSHVTLTPLIVYHDLDGEHYVSQEETLWSRVEYADMVHAVKSRVWWSDADARARSEAQWVVDEARIPKSR